MIADYLGAAHAYHGRKFTLEMEYEWWRRKIETKPMIHVETRNFVTAVFSTFAKNGKIDRITNLKHLYEHGAFR
jgi:hypothetical protein